MKKNNYVIIGFVVLLAVAIGIMAYALLSQNAGRIDDVSTTATHSSETQTTASLAGSIVKTTTATTTTQSTTEDEYAFLRKGAWYLVDTENEECIAIKFSKNGNADVAFFNSDNIEGFDAQYYKGYGSYDIRKDRIIFSKFPDVTGINNPEFKIKDNKIYYNGKKLKHFSKMNLDNALKCFE